MIEVEVSELRRPGDENKSEKTEQNRRRRMLANISDNYYYRTDSCAKTKDGQFC